MAEHPDLPSLLRLPLELRQHIYSYILPDLPIIETTTQRDKSYLEIQRHREYCLHAYGYIFSTPRDQRVRVPLRDDRQRCSNAILCVSRQIYEEATAYLYSRKFVIVVSAFFISFLNEEYQNLKVGGHEWPSPGLTRYRSILEFDRCFPLSKTRELHIRLDAPIVESPRCQPWAWLADEVSRHMNSLCEILLTCCRFEEVLPKITVELPHRFVEGMVFDDGYENIRPACIESALLVMRDRLRRVRSCKVLNAEGWKEDYPNIARLAEECREAVVLKESDPQQKLKDSLGG